MLDTYLSKRSQVKSHFLLQEMLDPPLPAQNAYAIFNAEISHGFLSMTMSKITVKYNAKWRRNKNKK